MSSTKDIRQEANALLASAETSLEEGNIESFEKQMTDAKAKMEKADQIDAATSELKALNTFEPDQGDVGLRA